MNQTLSLGYDPKCTLYKRQLKGGDRYYLSYYLPNGSRVRRPCHSEAKEAKRLLRLKELQLIQGQFDERDQEQMGLVEEKPGENTRLTLQEAVDLYLEVTRSRKRPHSHEHDTSALNRNAEFFRSLGLQFADEVTPVEVGRLINHLDGLGRKPATLKSALVMVKKLYNWLIEEAEFLQMRNPVTKRLQLPNKGSRVRDRLASPEEIAALLAVDVGRLKGVENTPLKPLLRFLLFTGARLGEVLHAEWSDFDLEQSIWHLRYKPQCPTKDGLGWGPKWNKARKVKLFPEALKVLESLPKLQTQGVVLIRDENRKIVERQYHPAQFVFPRKEMERLEDGSTKIRYLRLDSIKKSWAALCKEAGVENLQIKDLRTHFNHVLRSRCGFSAKEAGAYLGNSAEINDLHYTPISSVEMASKIANHDLSKTMSL